MKRYGRNFMLVLLCVVCAGADTPGDAAGKVREGLQHFRSGAFGEAETAFDQASDIDPENATIKYDEACAALAGGDAEQARSLFQAAALAKDAGLSVKAHYNLGCLEADVARTKLGEDPAAAVGETREESVKLLLASVRHYRDVLRLQPQHRDARHNLELIRLFIKHIQSQWAERDRQRDRQEKDLLQFLLMLEEKETALRSSTRQLQDHSASAAGRQAVRETAEAQRTLAEEIEPLKQKITESLQPQSAGPGSPGQPSSSQTVGQAGPDDDQTRQTLEIMHGIADEIGSGMVSAADNLAKASFDEAETRQTQTLSMLNQLYMAASPYDQLLSRAIKQQQRLAPPADNSASARETSEDVPTGETGADNNDENEANVADVTAVDAGDHDGEPVEGWPQAQEDQSRITDWNRVLPLKAEATLPQLRQQLESMKANLPAEQSNADDAGDGADDAGDDAGDAENEASASDDTSDINMATDAATIDSSDTDEDPQQQQLNQLKQQVRQLEGLVESMTRAIDLGPNAEDHSRSATQHLAAENALLAGPEQQETLRILREIAEPLQNDQDENQQDQDQQNDQNQQDQNQDQQGDDDQQQNQDSDQQDQNQSPQDQEQNEQQQQRDEQQREQEAKQQQAESVLRQARERERRHREQQKKLRAILQQGLKVDKDW